jgi:hypothetical protein
VQHVDLQRTEAAAEGNLLLRRDALVAKHQYVVVEVRAMNARKIFGSQRLAQIEPEDFGAHRAVEGPNFNGLGNGVVRGHSAVGSNRHTKLFGRSQRRRRWWRDAPNLPACTVKGNEANAIRLSAGVINPTLYRTRRASSSN